MAVGAFPFFGTREHSYKMATYILTHSNDCDLQSVAYVRQNSHTKMKDILGSVQKSNKIHIPYAHTKGDIELFTEEHDIRDERYAKKVVELPIGSVVLVPDGKKGLLVRITSETKTGVLDHLCVASSVKTCEHQGKPIRSGCTDCSNAVRSVFCTDDTATLQKCLREGCTIEPFWSLYRDCEVLGVGEYPDTDGRSVAGPDSFGNWHHKWILRNRVE